MRRSTTTASRLCFKGDILGWRPDLDVPDPTPTLAEFEKKKSTIFESVASIFEVNDIAMKMMQDGEGRIDTTSARHW